MTPTFFQRMMNPWMMNPFIVIAGGKALVSGLVFMLMASCLGGYTGAIQSGLISLRIVPMLPWWAYFGIPLIGWGIGATLFFMAGRCFSWSKIRVIDVFGTLALARIPISLIALVLTIPLFRQIEWSNPRPNDMLPLTLFSIITILLVVWAIVLTYNAFSVSCNLKGAKAIALYIGVILLSEMILAPASFLVLGTTKSVGPEALKSIATIQTPEGADAELVGKAKTVLEHIVKRQFDQVPPYFNAEMKAALSATALRVVWFQQTAMFGNVVKASPIVRIDEMQGYRRVMIDIKFERDEQVFLTTYDPDGNIAGMFFQKIQAK